VGVGVTSFLSVTFKIIFSSGIYSSKSLTISRVLWNLSHFKDVYTANKVVQDFQKENWLQLPRNQWKVERAPLTFIGRTWG